MSSEIIRDFRAAPVPSAPPQGVQPVAAGTRRQPFYAVAQFGDGDNANEDPILVRLGEPGDDASIGRSFAHSETTLVSSRKFTARLCGGYPWSAMP
jgi:hypothetical protein